MAQRPLPHNSTRVVLKKYSVVICVLIGFLGERAPKSSIRRLMLPVRRRKIWRRAILFANKRARERIFGYIKTEITSVVEFNSRDTFVFVAGIHLWL